MIDTIKLGQFVAEAMENLERQFPESELGDIMLIAEIRSGDTTTYQYVCSDLRFHIHAGLLAAAQKVLDTRDDTRPGNR